MCTKHCLRLIKQCDRKAHIACISISILTVPDPLVIGNDVSVAVGDIAVLTCIVSGTPPGTVIKYRWWRADDMSVIQGGNSTNYQVSSLASISDMGVYTCEVTLYDEGNSPLVIPASVSVNITLTVISKTWYLVVSLFPLPCMKHVACRPGNALALCQQWMNAMQTNGMQTNASSVKKEMKI